MRFLKNPPFYFLCLITTFVHIPFLVAKRCPLSARTENVVNKCPENEESTTTRAQIKKCERLEEEQNCTSPSKFKYHCLPTDLSGKLVEVCAVEIYIYGVCVLYNNAELQTYDSINCSQTLKCPDRFLSTEAHLYETCKLPYSTSSFSPINKTVTFAPDEDYKYTIVYTLLAVKVVILSCIGLICFINKRRETGRDEGDDTELRLLHTSEWGGNYETWRTIKSDKFSTLTDDEVSVLFCFLCSDSGPPDFIDTEWIDMLNKIQGVNMKKDPVTREEAQQTLERLKSRKFLWKYQDKISKHIKDEAMYRLASIDSVVPFHFSSYNTASVYLRSERYNRKPGEKCVISEWGGYDSSLIRRLQMNILTHVTMEDTSIYDKIHQILNIPDDILRDSKDKRGEFLMALKKGGEAVHYRRLLHDTVHHVTWLWRYGIYARPDILRSCIGLHPHNDIYIIDNKAYRKPSKYHQYSEVGRSCLYSLLLCDNYTGCVKEEAYKSILIKVRERYFQKLIPIHDVDIKILQHVVIETQYGEVTFISDDIRHDVMYAFVTECLVEDSDLEFFLTTASRDVISEYCRSWEYERSEGERCLYVPATPEKMYDLLIDRLQLDIIAHCTVSDRGFRASVTKRLTVPEEILFWELEARKRYIEISKEGGQNTWRARGMIVGCAGAGKTTLLRQLRRTQTNETPSPMVTTVGLEIYEDLFEIKDDTLIDLNFEMENKMDRSQEKEIISMTDFAGQVAYYACHQIYLSRRAFYLVVIDMSKGLDKAVHTQNTDRHNPKGSLFHGWTYKDYFLFWLRSIQTYCEDENRLKTKANPVILVATHLDCVQFKKPGSINAQNGDVTFYEKLEECLPEQHLLKSHISPERYFEIQCPPTKLNKNQLEAIEKVRKCIVKTARSLDHWGEKIPIKWTIFEQYLRERKGKRILSRNELQNISELHSLSEMEKEDMLRYFREIGLIIYFTDKNLKEDIIVDVQWFVDAFKNIITDPTQARSSMKSVQEWKTFMNTGIIADSTLVDVWSETSSLYVCHKNIIIPYMEKLGILATVRTKEGDGKMIDPLAEVETEFLYYIPSINRTDFSAEHRAIMNNGNKTPVLVFSFKTYIPHFFFFRLVALSFSLWEPLRDDLLCKNVAFYKDKGGDRNIAIAVNKTSIQLQVFTIDKKIQLTSDKTKYIRANIEKMIRDITTTFHHQVLYEVGYPCKDINITDEDEDTFLSEKTVAELETNERICPNYILPTKHKKHKIVRDDLLFYWFMDQRR